LYLCITDLIAVKVDHLSGRAVYKKDFFVPFIKETKMDEAVTAFSAGVQAAIWRYARELIEIGRAARRCQDLKN
jgi:hypothetical protein